GVNNVDLAAAAARGITVSNAVGYATPSVVQHTLSLILALANSLVPYVEDVRAGRWQQSKVFCLLDHPITELSGKCLGIVGYGELGSNVARVAAAFGMEVLISARPGANVVGEGRIAFDEILARADYVSLHCPLTPENENLIDADALQKMKPTAALINTARGGLVNSQDLLDALEHGSIGGAAIDVLRKEPPGAEPEPLLSARLPNLLVTPHNAWGARETRQRLVAQMRENIDGFLSGNLLRQVTTK
ncbi:MAG TPA: NAD(P)-dependent oxidoreductase, partial [Pseudomonadales bacterium]|nr:NAD(P)-dependent oxidoreductase [Pseudomonadales bacterium]